MYFDLNDGETVLETLIEYHLVRKDGTISILMEVELTDQNKGRFSAIPEPVLEKQDPKLVGFGESPNEALADCLSRIKSVPTNEIRKIAG